MLNEKRFVLIGILFIIQSVIRIIFLWTKGLYLSCRGWKRIKRLTLIWPYYDEYLWYIDYSLVHRFSSVSILIKFYCSIMKVFTYIGLKIVKQIEKFVMSKTSKSVEKVYLNRLQDKP